MSKKPAKSMKKFKKTSKNPRFYCFCGKLHVKNISLSLAITRIIITTDIMMVALSAKIFEYFSNQEITLPFYFTGVFLIENPVIFAATFCLIYGFVFEKPWGYIPQLVVDLIRIIIGGLSIATNIFISFSSSDENSSMKSTNGSVREERENKLNQNQKTDLFVDDKLLKDYLNGSHNSLFILCLGIVFFTWVVTFRTYQYMREIKAKNEPKIRTTGSTSTNDDVFLL